MEYKAPSEDRVHNLRHQLRTAEAAVAAETAAFRAARITDGWTPFVYCSSYYGSHSEYGEGDERRIYLFAPGVDSTPWADVYFGHGHSGCAESNQAFAVWLAALPDDQIWDLGPA